MQVAKTLSRHACAFKCSLHRAVLFSTKQKVCSHNDNFKISSAGQKQRNQMNRLRATLAIETLEQLPLPVASSVSKAGDRRNEFDEAKREKEFARMMRRKLAKHARAMHLPLFRQGSALFQRFGEKTLSDYDKLPKIQFDGPIAVIHSNEEEQEHAEYLWKQKVVGVDTEARPDFQPLKGSKGNPVCLIQISTLERAFLYRLQRGKPLPPILHDLFADSNVLKVGHSLSDDFRQLKLSNLVQAVNSTIDTLYITHKLGCLRPGLKTACQVMLGGSLDKDLQVSDWEAPSLSDAQIIYAATDAWAPLRVLLAAIQFKETLQLLRTISYSSSARAVVDENHDVILGKLLAFSLRHQIPTID